MSTVFGIAKIVTTQKNVISIHAKRTSFIVHGGTVAFKMTRSVFRAADIQNPLKRILDRVIPRIHIIYHITIATVSQQIEFITRRPPQCLAEYYQVRLAYLVFEFSGIMVDISEEQTPPLFYTESLNVT